MAKRFNGTWRDEYDNAYTFELYDDDFIGTSTAVLMDGVRLSYEGDGDDKIYSPIIPCVFECGIKASRGDVALSDFFTFLEDVATETEDRFWCRVKVASSTTFVFTGVMLLEEMQIPNSPIFTTTLTFVDSLTMLQDVEYKDSAGDYFDRSQFATLWEHFQNCMEMLPIFSRYDLSNDFVSTALEWSHTGQLSGNFLTHTRLKHDAFTFVDDDGNNSALSAYEVLERILKAFYLTLQYDPTPLNNYMLRHGYDLINLNFANEDRYKPNWGAIVGATQSRENPNPVKPLPVGNYGFLAGYREVKMKYDYNQDEAGTEKIDSPNEPAGYVSYGKYQLTTVDERLQIYGIIDTVIKVDSLMIWNVSMYYKVSVKLVRSSDSKTIYWGGDLQDETENAEGFIDGVGHTTDWELTEKGFLVYSSGTKWKRKGIHVFKDPYIRETSAISEEFIVGDEFEVFVKFEPIGMYATSMPSFNESNYTFLGYTRSIKVTIGDGAESKDDVTGLLVTGLIDANNSKKLEYNIKLGFGENASGSNLEIQTATGWEIATNKWKKTSGEYYLYELIIRDIYRLRRGTISTYEGILKADGIKGNMMMEMIDGDNYYPIRGEHDMRTSTFNGKFVKPTTFFGTPTISFTRSTDSSSGISNTTTGTTSDGDPGQIEIVPSKISFKVTGQTTTTFTISGIKVIDDTGIDDQEMELFIQLRRNNTIMTYNQTTQDKMSYKAEISGGDTIITIGRAAESDDVFTGWIAKVD